jgi:DNA-binding GntR family transcriptional regulator
MTRRAPSSLNSHAHNTLLAFFTAELKIGQRLPAQEDLARRCGASRTTIHRILEMLKKARLLRLKKHDGLFLARRPQRRDFLPQPNALSRREEVEQKLIDMLVRGQFHPGEFFSELALAKQCGVTTGTVR